MFHNLYVIKESDRLNSTYSFVGIQNNYSKNRLEFWLPHGFEDFPVDSFLAKKELFFGMYRTFQRFIHIHKDSLQSFIKSDRDGVFPDREGFQLKNEEGESVVLYSKLNMINCILDKVDELKITTVINKQAKSENVNYSQIDKYIHKAIFILPENVVFIDEMDVPRKFLKYTNTDLVEMFCFIYQDIKKELRDFNFPFIVTELASKFSSKYLTPTCSLFDEKTSDLTFTSLKEILDNIDRNSAYKDDDYWYFFDAIETFLYGKNVRDNTGGEYWGVNNFAFIWEDMCLNYFIKTNFNKILYLDVTNSKNEYLADISNSGSLNKRVFYQNGFVNPFKFKINNNTKSREIRPDLVYTEMRECNFNIKMKVKDIIKMTYSKNNGNANVAYKYKGRVQNPRAYLEKILNNIKSYPKIVNSSNPDYDTCVNLSKKQVDDFNAEAEKELIEVEYIEEVPVRVVADFKYYSIKMMLDRKNEKIRTDVKKQLVYEYALQQQEKIRTESEFWIPNYKTENKNVKSFNCISSVEQIKIFEIDFIYLQNLYITDYDNIR